MLGVKQTKNERRSIDADDPERAASGEHTVARICGPGSPLAVLRGSSLSLAEVPKEKHAMADKTGACLCGAVAFEITGPLRSVIAM